MKESNPQGIAAIIPAAGQGMRLKSKVSKPFISLLGEPMLVHAVRRLFNACAFDEAVVLTDAGHVRQAKKILRRHGFAAVRVELGGVTRADSVRRGVMSLSGASSWVLVHDAARPWVSRSVVLATLRAAKASGAAISAMPVTATLKRLRPARNIVMGTEDRQFLCTAQTPQVFRRDLLLSRYRALGQKAYSATDEAALFDRTSIAVQVVPGDSRNIKVTTRDDLELVTYYIKKFGAGSSESAAGKVSFSCA